jgi:hypothetical protein
VACIGFLMPKLVRALLLGISFCLILFIGGVFWLAYGDCTAFPQRLYHRILLGEKDFIAKDARFKIGLKGIERAPDGHWRSFTDVRASDCVEVTVETERMGSPAEAESEMEKRIRRASRVAEQEPTLDRQGHPDGERAVLLFENDARAQVVLWFTGHSYLNTIRSASLAHALAYEKLIQNGYTHDPHGYVIALGQ